jgi:hypothetical protein
MAKYQIYPPRPKPGGLLVHSVRILADDGTEYVNSIREKPGSALALGSPVAHAENMFQEWRAEMGDPEGRNEPQIDGGRMLAHDEDYI